ncbi:DUF2254 domain-containing protein [Microbacterium thalassium]|uniref:Putative membrane protein n=1 Tax=Microbacterium thalassium TaxID=362649 RepID=A0A7X0FLZ2_9MICO|nr:DUF2254 domain-containing protein [Microbacterium thalassium]MBB6389916.1 putative membrane protein [Microbacterium thalassium]GLK24603.1 hypothetical protein GCM10017607_19210 [Microbacterium thalassium]
MTRPGGAVRRRLASITEAIASRLWPLPLVAVIAGVILGVALPVIDRAVDASLPSWVGTFVFSGGVDAARAVLSAIAGSLITAASLTFSLTVVALQLASSQASPRLLRMFASDRMVHATLAMFLGTFAYALTVLRTVEDATEDADEFVPRLALTAASVLTLSSVIVLTFFLAHLARQLRVETMMRDVHREASETIALMADDAPGAPAAAPARPGHARTVPAPTSGFITGVDREALVRVAAEADAVVRELRTVGENVVEGTPLIEWWPSDPMVRPDAETSERLAESLAECFSAAYERTPPQDVGFGLRQLADVAAKALSPGVNDPTTAVHALGHIAAVLGDLAERDERPAAWADADGAARLIPAGGGFADFAEVGLQQIRRYGAGDPDVAARLFAVIDDVAWRARRPSERDVLLGQLERLEASVAREDYDEVERARFADLGARARATLGRA